MLAACGCFMGAWWTRESADPDGRVRIKPIPFADSLKDLPSGLSDLDWRWLKISRTAGDGYVDAAYRFPTELVIGKIRVVGMIERWMAADPPKWDPDAGENRKPEAPESAEERAGPWGFPTEEQPKPWHGREMERLGPEEEQEDLPF